MYGKLYKNMKKVHILYPIIISFYIHIIPLNKVGITMFIYTE